MLLSALGLQSWHQFPNQCLYKVAKDIFFGGRLLNFNKRKLVIFIKYKLIIFIKYNFIFHYLPQTFKYQYMNKSK